MDWAKCFCSSFWSFVPWDDPRLYPPSRYDFSLPPIQPSFFSLGCDDHNVRCGEKMDQKMFDLTVAKYHLRLVWPSIAPHYCCGRGPKVSFLVAGCAGISAILWDRFSSLTLIPFFFLHHRIQRFLPPIVPSPGTFLLLRFLFSLNRGREVSVFVGIGLCSFLVSFFLSSGSFVC